MDVSLRHTPREIVRMSALVPIFQKIIARHGNPQRRGDVESGRSGGFRRGHAQDGAARGRRRENHQPVYRLNERWRARQAFICKERAFGVLQDQSAESFEGYGCGRFRMGDPFPVAVKCARIRLAVSRAQRSQPQFSPAGVLLGISQRSAARRAISQMAFEGSELVWQATDMEFISKSCYPTRESYYKLWIAPMSRV
jgi:hypothetical protein